MEVNGNNIATGQAADHALTASPNIEVQIFFGQFLQNRVNRIKLKPFFIVHELLPGFPYDPN